MGIYTKRGDKGKTKIISSDDPVSKNSPLFSALGTLDELSSYLGIVISASKRRGLTKEIKRIQKNLLTIGSILAGSKLALSKDKVSHLENEIDKMEKKLPVINNFILPNGTKVSTHLMFARTIARRAERVVVSAGRKSKFKGKTELYSYLNRLSDYLFILARDENKRAGVKEDLWKG